MSRSQLRTSKRAATREAYTNELARIIKQYPERFSASVISTANHALNTDFSTVDDVSFSFPEFFGAVVDEAASINEAVNPLSASNRKYILWLAVAGAAVYFLTPIVAPHLAKAFSKK